MKKVVIYTDGASRGNPGRGGWSAIIITEGTVVELGGYSPLTTNNQMELQGALEGLLYSKEHFSDAHITLHTDSQYVLLGIEKWVYGWQKNGWQTKQGEPVKNKELWQALTEVNQSLNVSWQKVKGHAGDLGNERADYIATSFADNQKADVYEGPLEGYYALESQQSFPCYVSFVDGILEYHKTWAECQKRVEGTKGSLYKKLLSASEEEKWLNEKGIKKS